MQTAECGLNHFCTCSELLGSWRVTAQQTRTTTRVMCFHHPAVRPALAVMKVSRAEANTTSDSDCPESEG